MAGRPGRQQKRDFQPVKSIRFCTSALSLNIFPLALNTWKMLLSVPQEAGLRLRGGLVDIGAISNNASRLFAFNASDGSTYDIVFLPGII
ncbi:MAG: hypothetical protein U5K75_08535 [Ahrensia sp.]|nr:hypothetical protein [Ahrensia sp.]